MFTQALTNNLERIAAVRVVRTGQQVHRHVADGGDVLWPAVGAQATHDAYGNQGTTQRQPPQQQRDGGEVFPWSLSHEG
jgi:hypothetical protein